MTSFVWQRDPDEAYNNPYEYEGQQQFLREADVVLDCMRTLLNEYDMKFHRDDRSVTKAIWLLQTDALASLIDARTALDAMRHRAAARVFRDVVETLDLAKYFASQTEASERALARWYDDEIVSHSEYRKYVERAHGTEVALEQRRRYANLSKFTHRSYRAITACCGLGVGDMMWHENHSKTEITMLPFPVAAYCAVLASFILEFCSEVASRGLVEPAKVRRAFSESMEDHVVPRRFMINGPWREDP